jgi:hypothetical protein
MLGIDITFTPFLKFRRGLVAESESRRKGTSENESSPPPNAIWKLTVNNDQLRMHIIASVLSNNGGLSVLSPLLV